MNTPGRAAQITFAALMYLFQHKAAAASQALFDFSILARCEDAKIRVAGARDHGKVSGQVHYLDKSALEAIKKSRFCNKKCLT